MPATPSPAPTLPRCYALIPCAGSGSRSGQAGPKQYALLMGQRLVDHTLAALAAVPALCAVALVVAPDDTQAPAPVPAGPERAQALWVWPVGGASRAQSVYHGLLGLARQGAQAHDWVLVHDAARCLVTPAQVQALVDAVLAHALNSEQAAGGLLAVPLADTLKAAQTLSGGEAAATATLPREHKWLAQTPQMFRLGALTAALQAAEAHGFAGITDEASAMEAAGAQPLLVPGSALNFKLTYPEDFVLAEAVLRARAGSGPGSAAT
jgi:2-C-methyl-D-erythritol 4-phosphate cytidylyltransferase